MMKLEDKRFLMYVLPRSGSTSMVCLFQAHPDIGEMRFEPFHSNRASTHEELDKKFRELRQIDGFKIHADHLLNELVTAAFKKCRKVILMDRRNILKSAVSHEKAWETGVWNIKPGWKGYEDFPLTNFGRMQRTIQRLSEEREFALSVLKRENINYYHFVYEDFYLTHEEDKIEQLKGIFEFLGHEPVVNKRMLRILRMKRMNDERSYLRIPNIYEIERELGSNKNGWLLTGGLQL